MEFKQLFELGYEYDKRALSEVIFQISDYNQQPMSKEKRKELGYKKALLSNSKEKEIFENYLHQLQEDMAFPLCYRVNGIMQKMDERKQAEIYNCVLIEVERIIKELSL